MAKQRWSLTSAQVNQPFQGAGEVICTETPAGEVAMITHIGSYAKLRGAHEAISSWRTITGRTFGMCSWKMYGEWNNDLSEA
jgi:hypothetical protein